MVERHRGSRGVRKARAAVELIRVGADSPPETRLRLALVRAGLPEPVLNHVVWGEDSWGGPGSPVLWPDAAYPQWRIALQYEGAHHNGEDQYLRDIRRADTAARSGWLEVRVSRLDLAGGHPAAVRQGPQRVGEPGLARELTVRGSVFEEHCREVRTRCGGGRRVCRGEYYRPE